MNDLDQLESRSVHILREAYREFKDLCLLWSIGKDSTVMLWLARKAFFGHLPFPLLHIDTAHKIPEMIEWRDRLVREWRLNLLVGQNREALARGETYPAGQLDRIACCRCLKTLPLQRSLSGEWPCLRFDHALGRYVPEQPRRPFTGVIVGARADEEGSRSKARTFSPRDRNNDWDVDDQPPELWEQYQTEFAPGTHIRIHPLLDWTELNLWQYILRESIPVTSLYFDHGNGLRYRSLGCAPCTSPVRSGASTVAEIVQELRDG